MKKINWYQSLAELVAKRSTCLRRRVGAIAVRDDHILATGYNGAPKGVRHCSEVGCLREQLGIPAGERHELCRAVHAEQNLLTQAALTGICLNGADVYATHSPCFICAKMLINAGIKAIWYAQGYPDANAINVLEEAGVVCENIAKKV